MPPRSLGGGSSRRVRGGVAIASTLFVAAWIALAPGEALADPLRASLTVRRGAGAERCPDGQGLGARVDALAGAPLVGGDAPASVQIEIAFDRIPRGLRATMKIGGARTGERILEDKGTSCEALTEAVAITTLVVLDATPKEAPPPGPPAPPGPPPAPPGPPPAPPGPPPVPPKPAAPAPDFERFVLPAIERPEEAGRTPEPRRRFGVAAGAVYDDGTLGEDALGLSVRLDAYFRWVSIGLELVTLPRDSRARPSRDVVFDFWAGRAHICAMPLARSYGIAICQGFLAGRRSVRVVDAAENEATASGNLVEATFEIELSVPLAGPIGIFAGLTAGVPILSGSIDIDEPRGFEIDAPDPIATFEVATGLRVYFDP